MDKPASLHPRLIIGFSGLNVPLWLFEALSEQRLAGVLLFERNVSSREQVKALSAELKRARGDCIIAIDQEGGLVSRLPWLRTRSAQVLAGLGLEETKKEAAATAAELKELGITLNFAPVIDLSTASDNFISQKGRCYGRDAATVIEHARCVIETHRAEGLSCVLKHYPGHGSSVHDSHLEAADISETWQPEELEPYRALIASGHADAIMLAHVQHRHLAGKEPVSLSSQAIAQLRQELGFKGTLISDDLDMAAIAAHRSLDQAVAKAELAGVDLMIAGHSFAQTKALFAPPGYQ